MIKFKDFKKENVLQINIAGYRIAFISGNDGLYLFASDAEIGMQKVVNYEQIEILLQILGETYTDDFIAWFVDKLYTDEHKAIYQYLVFKYNK